MTNASRNLFISYRRGDNSQFAERIRDCLVSKYGRDNVFMDFDSIPPFVDFEKHIIQKVKTCDVLVVLIGPRWGDMFQEKIKLNEPDYVKLEIETALKANKLIAPILIEGAKMPSSKDIPIELHPIFKLNAQSISSGKHFSTDIEMIIKGIEYLLNVNNAVATSSASKLRKHNLEDETILDSEMINFNIKITIQAASVSETTRKLASRLLHEAGDKWQVKNFDGAIEILDEIVSLLPNFAWAYNSRAACKKAKGDFEGAIKDYDKAIELDSSLAEAYHNKGILYLTKGEYKTALDCFTNAIKLSHKAESYGRRGTVYWQLGDYTNSLADYEKAIELDNQNWMHYNNLGAILRRYGELDTAAIAIEMAINLAIKITPLPYELIETYFTYARILDAKGNIVQALAALENAIQIDPKFSDAYDLMGILLSKLGKTQEAINAYAKAIKNNPLNPRYFSNRGWAKYESGDIDGAISDYNQSIDVDKDFAAAYNNRGLAQKYLGKLDNALIDFTSAISMKYENLEWAYTNRGSVHLDKGNYMDAIKDCTDAIMVNDQYANAYMIRSIAHEQLMMFQESLNDLKKYVATGGGKLNNNQREVEEKIKYLRSRI